MYSLAAALALLLSAPWWLLRMAATRRYREGLGERLGRPPERLRALLASLPAGGRVVWVHAVSVGEVLAARRLVVELEAAIVAHSHAPCTVLLSTTTRTGQALAREHFGADHVFYLPFDFAFAVRCYLRLLQPSALVLMESEIWPRLLFECRRRDIPVAVVNARVSDRSFARALRVRAVWGRVLRGVTLWLAQSAQDAERLVAMSATAGSVRAVGNLKYDARDVSAGPLPAAIQALAGGRRIVVAGSTVGAVHRGGRSEEEMVLAAWSRRLRAQGVLLVLAPRHPERFAAVVAMAAKFHALRATEILREESPAEYDASYSASHRIEVVVLDTIGALAGVYGVAQVAFVGGSLVSRGGHNPLEPAQWAIPVIMGPSWQNFRAIVTAMQQADAIDVLLTAPGETEFAGIHTLESALENALEPALTRLLDDPAAARAMGERGRLVCHQQQGASSRTTAALIEMLFPGEGPASREAMQEGAR